MKCRYGSVPSNLIWGTCSFSLLLSKLFSKYPFPTDMYPLCNTLTLPSNFCLYYTICIQNDVYAMNQWFDAHDRYCIYCLITWITRQSEMATTSPRHMPVLGNVHPIKIENFDIFSWRHFSARSSFYIINWYGYPRGSHEKYLKEIVSPVFEIRHLIVTC